MITAPAPLADPGSLTFFTGPMACGKTLELVRHLQIFHEQKIPVVCLRPQVDTRSTEVHSRSGLLYQAETVDPRETDTIRQLLEPAHVIGIDEVEFFTEALIPLLLAQLRQGKTILLSGLDTDFRGRMFPTAQALMAIPEAIIHRMRAVCAVCLKHNATRSQRLRNGQPVSVNDPTVIIENAQENITYEARCLAHHTLIL